MVSLRSEVRVTVEVTVDGVILGFVEAVSFVDALRRKDGELSSEERVEVALLDTDGLRSELR